MNEKEREREYMREMVAYTKLCHGGFFLTLSALGAIYLLCVHQNSFVIHITWTSTACIQIFAIPNQK